MTYPAQPLPYPHQPPAPAAPARVDVSSYVGPGLGVLGALLVVVGSLMPWGTIQTMFGTISVNGTDGDGVITLGAGVLLALGAVLTGAVQQLWLAIVQTVFAFAVAGLGVFEIVRVASGLSDAGSEFARVSIGVGLWVLLLGAAVGFTGAFLHIGYRSR